MKVLGMDPSLTNFGWCLVECSPTEISPIDHGRFQTDSKTLFVDRYISLRESVRELISKHNPDKISCEYPIFDNLYSEGMYGLFLFTCEAVRTSKKDIVFFSPGQGKAHARLFLDRPKGWKMEKTDMVEACKLAVGKTWNHNEADAYWISRAGSRFWMFVEGVLPEEEMTSVEIQQFTKVHTFKKGKRAGQTKRSGIAYREDERFFRWSQE